MFEQLDLIIKGITYEEKWVPLSSRGSTIEPYTVDIRECFESIILLRDTLKQKYKVNLYISTYDNTPSHILSEIENTLLPKDIFLCSKEGSSQFTTLINALNKIPDKPGKTLVLRGDMIVQDKLIDLLFDTKLPGDRVGVLCKTHHPVNYISDVIDTFQYFDNNVKEKFKEFISKPGLEHAHRINDHVPVKLLIDEYLRNTYSCSEYFIILPYNKIEYKHS